jgi:hypothetical protein
MASPVSSSARKKLVPIEIIPEEGIDQPLGLAGEPGDHPNPETFGNGQEAAIEAAAQQNSHSSGGEDLEAFRPLFFGDGQSADAANLVPIQVGDHELVCRAESGGHVSSVKGNAQHRSLLLGRAVDSH